MIPNFRLKPTQIALFLSFSILYIGTPVSIKAHISSKSTSSLSSTINNAENPNNGNDEGNASYKKGKKVDSKLKDGNWYRIKVDASGLYKVDFNFLKDHGIDPASLDGKKIGIYGYGGASLPELNSKDRPEDMAQIPSFRSGLDDGKFDEGDFIVFYAEGSITWKLIGNGSFIRHLKHPYSDKISYFINTDGETGDKPERANKISATPNVTSTSYDYVDVHEVDLYTEITKNVKSGKEWFGEDFSFNTYQEFKPSSIPEFDATRAVKLRSLVAARSIGPSSKFDVTLNGQEIITHSLNATTGKSDSPYAYTDGQIAEQKVSSNQLTVGYSYSKPNAQANGWLNYFEINARSKLIYNGKPLIFRDLDAIVGEENVVEYQIQSSTPNLVVWDITDINNIKEYQTDYENGKVVFRVFGDGSLRQYAAFEKGHGSSPEFVGKVENQNLHGLPFAKAFIITHKDFKQQADALAEFHRNQEKISVNVVDISKIYNEFSSGNQDVVAIRDFMRYFYSTAESESQKPEYLLLIGDASYDFKDRIPENTNFVPSYQSSNSTNLGSVYVTDDFFGLLDDWDGDFSGDSLDLAIGRIPVQTATEASQMVEKIKSYYANSTMGSWRNDICFVADDEDSNTHIDDTEDLARSVSRAYPNFNQKKIYFDAYVQEASAGGSRYPDVERRLYEVMESGILVMNYMGHGGELGWAHERVLELEDINGWENIDNMPLIVTATCEFARYDDPLRVSAGEQAFLNPKGGAIALLTTTRLVYTTSNKAILDRLFKENIFEPENNEYRTLGEIIKKTKNDAGLSIGVLKFSLIGDPIMKLAYPSKRVVTTKINGLPASNDQKDTLKALSKVTVEGNVTGPDGSVLTDFNGIVYPTVFDKPDTIYTLKNDASSRIRKFDLQKNIIYKGKATVNAGEFKYEFVVPKDISYKMGEGKISYYTENGEVDGNGFYTDFFIGGTSDNLVNDDEGPESKLYVNDISFAFGGLTDENPILIGVLKDDNGINTVGTGIGHELTLTLDDEAPIVVNEYYESELDDYTQGKVTYPFKSLEEGRHSVTLKAWDIANNATEAYTEFVVANSAELALDHVLNYPNPFTTNTLFRFDHNKPGDILDVTIQIFSVSGRLVKTLQTQSVTSGSTFTDLSWDGRDDFGNNIGRGVYLYRIKVKSSDGNSAEEMEKLVLLR